MSHHRMHPYNNVQNGNTEQRPVSEQPRENDLPMTEDAESQEQALQQEKETASAEEAARKSAEEAKKEIDDMRLRMAAEMDNFKKRLTREHQEQMRYASEKVLGDLLPALDNLDLALQYASRHEACRDMMQGIEMTRKQLLDATGKHGLVSIGQPGEEFNPEIHEAIGMESNPEAPKGTVSRVMQRGYKLNDRLLRPAKVMVNN